jgi:hypothetical protein
VAVSYGALEAEFLYSGAGFSGDFARRLGGFVSEGAGRLPIVNYLVWRDVIVIAR